MRYSRLFSSERQYEVAELRRLEKLATAARLGTACLGCDTAERSAKKDETTPAQARTTEPCSQTLEDCHAHA